MNPTQIQDALDALFKEPDARIVFWHDAEKEFEDALPGIDLGDVRVIRLDDISPLRLKIDIERGDPISRYLLYAPFHEPPPEADWLLDMRLYSRAFHADKASILLNDLNLHHRSLRPHLKQRRAFFSSKDRLNRLKKWIQPDDREDDIDLKMLAVIVRSDGPDLFSILMKVFESCCGDDGFDPATPSKPWSDIEKLGLAPAFWNFVARTFGYIDDFAPKRADFLLRLFVTDFANGLKTDPPASLSHFVIQSPSHAVNAAVFLSQWRRHLHGFRHYNTVSAHIAKKLKLPDALIGFSAEALVDVMTFEAVERRIISGLRDRIVNADANANDTAPIRDIIKARRDGYWATAILQDDSRENLYKTVYTALETAIDLLERRTDYDGGFSYPGAAGMVAAYTDALFRFDQDYRIFSERADRAETAGWDVLKTLRQSVEDLYSGWFMDHLSLAWGNLLDGEKGLLQDWKLPDIVHQCDFFSVHVEPVLRESGRNRVFVVVSDAFRYEAAESLQRIVNGKYRLKAELEPMLGVLPSDTAMGMAALLPHEKLSIHPKSGQVLVDGQPSSGFDDRVKILSHHRGIAVRADDLTAMSKAQGRAFVKPHRLVYVYHDRIDAVGDKAASESRAFKAVREAIDDLSGLINFIINSLNGTRIVITADHGFVYQDKPPAPLDKSALETAGDPVKRHKRFVLGRNLGDPANAHRSNTRITARTDADFEMLFPKGTNRFNFLGGARFYHGGPLPQEIILPALTVTEVKGKHLQSSEITQVGVSLIGTHKKIVTNIARFEFIQTEAVSDRTRPRSLKISLRDGNAPISDEKWRTFDSASDSLDDRKTAVSLTLKTGQTFDNKRDYHLVLRNADDETEYDRIPVAIDIAFASDF